MLRQLLAGPDARSASGGSTAARPDVRRRHGRRLRPGRDGRRHRGPDDPARHRADASRSASCSRSPAGCSACDAATVVEDPARLRPDASEVLVLQSDPSLARELLGWQATTTPRGRASAATIEWLRAPARAAARGRPCPALSRPASRIPLAEPTIGGNAAALPRRVPRDELRVVGRAVRRAVRARVRRGRRARYAVACASGTAAIHLALRVLDVGPGDEVLVPTDVRRLGQPGPYVGATPVLVDSEADDLQPGSRAGRRRSSSGGPRRAAGSRRRSRSSTSLGHPADLEPIARRRPSGTASPVIEDASEALGRDATSAGRSPAARSARSGGSAASASTATSSSRPVAAGCS